MRSTDLICFQGGYIQFKYTCFGRDRDPVSLRPNDIVGIEVKGVPLPSKSGTDQVIETKFQIPGNRTKHM